MPSVPNPPGTPNASNVNPLTPATPSNTGSGGTAAESSTISPGDIPLKDWQAALGTYLALIWMAEVPSLAPFAVSIAWGTAIIYAIHVNLPKLLADAVSRGTAKAAIGGQVSTINPPSEIIPAT